MTVNEMKQWMTNAHISTTGFTTHNAYKSDWDSLSFGVNDDWLTLRAKHVARRAAVSVCRHPTYNENDQAFQNPLLDRHKHP